MCVCVCVCVCVYNLNTVQYTLSHVESPGHVSLGWLFIEHPSSPKIILFLLAPSGGCVGGSLGSKGVSVTSLGTSLGTIGGGRVGGGRVGGIGGGKIGGGRVDGIGGGGIKIFVQFLKLSSLPIQTTLSAKYVLVSDTILGLDRNETRSSELETNVPKSWLQAVSASLEEKVDEHVLCQVLLLHISTCPERPVVSL